MPISDLLLGSGTPSSSAMVTIEGATPTANQSGISAFTPVNNLDATLAATSSGAIQLVIVAEHRAFMKITIDSKDAYIGRVEPGTIYSYSGNTEIDLLTGDGSALEVYYNQQNLGILGSNGQVVSMQFTPKQSINVGAQYTATPAPTQLPTLTANPTATSTQTPILIPTPSTTPSITGG
jgi:cytoskeleton protein RodZ